GKFTRRKTLPIFLPKNFLPVSGQGVGASRPDHPATPPPQSVPECVRQRSLSHEASATPLPPAPQCRPLPCQPPAPELPIPPPWGSPSPPNPHPNPLTFNPLRQKSPNGDKTKNPPNPSTRPKTSQSLYPKNFLPSPESPRSSSAFAIRSR